MTTIRLRSTIGSDGTFGVYAPGLLDIGVQRWYEDQLWTWRYMTEGLNLPVQAVVAIVTGHATIELVPTDDAPPPAGPGATAWKDALITYDETANYSDEFYRYQRWVNTPLPLNWRTTAPKGHWEHEGEEEDDC